MSDVTPASKSEPSDDPFVEPVIDAETGVDAAASPRHVEPAAESESPVEEAALAAGLVEPTVPAEPPHALVEPTAPAETEFAAPPVMAPVGVAPIDATPAAVVPVVPAPTPQQYVYMAPPEPPKKRGNRGIGVLLSVVGAILFAAVYAAVAELLSYYLGAGRALFGSNFIALITSSFFWVPVAVFLVALILLALLLNRAGWWAHVLGSLVLAFAVYLGTIGVLLFVGDVLGQSPTPVTFLQLALNPLVIAAAVVAREVSIWIGLAIAARGRRVKARNVDARTAWDREQEAKRAEYGGPAVAA